MSALGRDRGLDMTLTKMVVAAAAAVALGTGLAGTVAAYETGLDAIHSQRREGGRVCFADHFHYGSSYNVGSRRAAELTAVRSWADLTVLEYGSSWGSYRLAASKSMRCGRGSGLW